jgi:photosystem II stability/assembly factor-like uncharacterized protein
MKNIYSILSLLLVFTSVSMFGQTRVYAPSLHDPENMAVGQMPDVKLDWNAVTGSGLEILYGAELADNPDFTDAEVFEPTNVTAIAMVDLEFGGTYYWRVRAFEDGVASDWSETWSFTVLWSITMKNPVNGNMEYVDPKITWEGLTGITGYQLQVDTVYEWNLDQSGVTSDIIASSIVTDSDMWAVGLGGLVLHFDGTQWSQVDVGSSANFNDVCFIDASNGFIVGDEGTILYFDGSTWTAVDVGSPNNINGVSFADINNGVVVGDTGLVAVYTDGLWEKITTGDENELYDVDMVNANSIWACGLGKIVVNYDGIEWSANVIGNKDHYSISMVDENTGWTVGKSGKIYRWNGMLWYEEESNTPKNLNGVSFDGMNGYAVGEAGTLLMYNGAWNPSTSEVTLDDILRNVVVSGNNGLVVGDAGIVIRKVDIGFNSPYLFTLDLPADTASWELDELLFGHTFYYRLRAFHGSDTNQWSGPKSLTTIRTTTLLSPTDGTDEDLEVEFKWSEYDGITNYIIEIATDENFTEPRIFVPIEDTIVVNDLIFGQQYYWRVAAQHALDISDWSDVWSISTVNNIIQETPENNAQDVIRCPLFDWIDVVGASGFEVWIDTDISFGNPEIHEVEDQHFQCQSAMDGNTVFFWKVRGKSGDDFSEWSETWSFKTEGNIGIEEQLLKDAISVYPNPAVDIVNLSINSTVVAEYTVRIIDITGKIVQESIIDCQVGRNTFTIDASNITSGSYNLNISDGKQVVSKGLLIK